MFSVKIPNTLKEIEGKGEEEFLGYEYLKILKDKPSSRDAGNRWIQSLNFNYLTKANSFMVDGHEHEKQKEYRKYFTTNT